MTNPAMPGRAAGQSRLFFRPLRQAPRLVARSAHAVRPSAARTAPSSARPSSRRPSTSPARCSRSPPTIASASCRLPTPAPSRWRCGRCSAPAPVDVLAWESFGEGWVTDVVKQLKLKDARMLKAAYGELPDLAEVDFAHDVVFTWNGTTSGVRVPERRLDRRRPRRASPSATRPPPPSRRTSPWTSSMSSPSPGRRCWAARRRTAC